MSNLWNLAHIKPNHDIVMPGETIPAMFWNAVHKRGPNVWMRQKHLGIWQIWTWEQSGQAVRGSIPGPHTYPCQRFAHTLTAVDA